MDGFGRVLGGDDSRLRFDVLAWKLEISMLSRALEGAQMFQIKYFFSLRLASAAFMPCLVGIGRGEFPMFIVMNI